MYRLEIVTNDNCESFKDFGRHEHIQYGDLHKRARESRDVITGLGDSFGDDAFVRDTESMA